MSKTAAQEEFDDFIAKNSTGPDDHIHPEDRAEVARERDLHARDNSDDEEESYRAAKVDAAMRMSTYDTRSTADLMLPPASFDSGRATGVKGVIADARNYENARRSKWSEKMRNARRSVIEFASVKSSSDKSDSELSGAEDEESFLKQWRESRRRELEAEDRSSVRNRRTSPSARMYGRFEEVDAMGYLDAIEKVSRETTVVVFVYDHESDVSSTIESAMMPLVRSNPAIRFVKVHYEEIELDQAGVPAVLAYRNQGDLFANLTALIDMIPDEEDFDSDSLKKLFQEHRIV
ncbi:putative phosducin [Diaporthe ampelina]|uniref:Putative phosducin n=1 Tax=Diaporthe ampelina TaxID=1214573 RepID=A0A0G2FX96_9PEZI|nr:putative phosducin [Diaporthe ampelina]